MLQKKYFKNYLKIYSWQGTGVLLDIISMFVVIPAISNNPKIFGIYTVCISTSLFLKYADIGFISAGFKYAAESFAKNDRQYEIRLFGFTGFILFIFISLISIFYLYLGFYPNLILKDLLRSDISFTIASNLLFIQAIFSFNIIFTRIFNGIFSIRIENYIKQKLNIIGSIIKILSVFFFFYNGKYDIVGYFIFLKTIDLLINIGSAIIIKTRYEYNLYELLKCFKYDKEIFKKTKTLAMGSLFITIMWILYYEIDLLVIGKFLGPVSAGLFAIAFTFIRFFRNMTSILFGPFQARYNHFVGVNDIQGLRTILLKVILLTMPIVVFLLLSIIILKDNIILSWVGPKYLNASWILFFLAINASFSFISIPSSEIIVVLEKIKSMYFINGVRTLLYWLVIFLFFDKFQVLSFPLAKLLAGFIAMLLLLNELLKVLNISFIVFLKKTLSLIIIPSCFQAIFLLLIKNYLPNTKGIMNLIYVIGIGGISFIIAFAVLYFSSNYYKQEANHYYKKIIPART